MHLCLTTRVQYCGCVVRHKGKGWYEARDGNEAYPNSGYESWFLKGGEGYLWVARGDVRRVLSRCPEEPPLRSGCACPEEPPLYSGWIAAPYLRMP